MKTFSPLSSLALTALALLPLASAQAVSSLPIVDLGYQRHQAINFSSTTGLYNFSNIRYAAPPTGNNRFRAPQSPATDRSVVRDGSIGRICPQAEPSWTKFAPDWIPNYLFNKPLNVTQAQLAALNSTYSKTNIPPMDPRTTEDCLFLDVIVPKSIFDKRSNGSTEGTGAPVLVWVYGGGYTVGDKSEYDPTGLISRSTNHSMEGVVWVAMNYRLGAFGWLAGPSLQEDGVANAGLYDQRFALEWVQKNIHLFGGDPCRVTVMGESAGGGSIMHQITAYGGRSKAPFQQAILQSAAFFPITSNEVQENDYNQLLNLTGAANLPALRAVSMHDLIAASFIQVYESPYGEFYWGPSVDHDFVPGLPGQLLLQGEFDKTVKVMTGHNSNEGLIFTDPFIQNETTYETFLHSTFPVAEQSVIDYIDTVLYPNDLSGAHGYTNEIGRVALSIAESTFICNAYYLDTAFKNETYAYTFSIFPGIHGQDLAYTFYNGGGVNFATLLFNTTAAIILQDYIVTYAINGKPSAPDVPGLPEFIMYGSNATVQNIELSSVVHSVDPAANSRCDWWQQALYE